MAYIGPYSGKKLYVEPNGNAAKQSAKIKPVDPAGSAIMERVSRIPISLWLGEWVADPQKTVDDMLTKAGESLCVFTVYAVPQRDCGSLSAGGVSTAADYAAFVGKIAAGLKNRLAIVILEPDGLAVTHCLSTEKLAERHAMMSSAVDVLTAAGAKVYIDAGDSNWIPSDKMAESLKAAGVAKAAGFALNVSHFEPEANEHLYAAELRKILGTTAHYVVDTSRCGQGKYEAQTGEDEDIEWCNPPGRGYGRAPTLETKKSGLDAILWIKRPGESDGAAFGGPAAGKWWDDYALNLAWRANPVLPK